MPSFSALFNATLALWASSSSLLPVQQLSTSISNNNNYSPPSSIQIQIPTKTIGQDVYGNGVDLPLLGAGTWQYNDTIAYESVCKAFAAGYTFVDTALGYGNQRGVGRAIANCWTKPRDELFVMTKIPGGLTASETLAAHQQNLDQLGLDYVDHVMTHFPADWHVTPDRSSKERRQEEWMGLENLYYRRLARSIGISHYCPDHIDDVLEVATVQPSINQVEYHVGSGDVDAVIAKCAANRITFMSFSPLCGPCEYEPKDSLINGELVSNIGKKYGVTGSQVSLRFMVQQALERTEMGGVIPKSNNMEHIQSNMDIFSFELSDEDMKRLSAASKPTGETGDCEVP